MINGHFRSDANLTLVTSNGAIDTVIDLINPKDSSPAQLVQNTSNGHVTSSISLSTLYPTDKSKSASFPGTGGSFDTTIHTSNAALHVTFPTSPPSSLLTLAAITSNARASVELSSAYEGSFGLFTSSYGGVSVVERDGVEDPSGKERKRSIVKKVGRRGVVEGSVWWGQDKGEHGGSVVVKTSNGGNVLYL